MLANRDGRFGRGFARLGLRLLAVLVLSSAALLAESRAYHIEPSPDSQFALEVYKTGLMSGKKHLLVFEQYEGRLEFDRENPEQARVELTIESGSLAVKDDWVNDKDRRKIADEALNNKLQATQHPEMRFRSDAIRAQGGEGRYEVQGELTIRKIARPVVVQVSLREGPGDTLLFDGEAVVRMKDYGMKPPSAALGLIGTRNEMAVSFRLQAVPAAP
jgi:polyisoprenoid-binding protein YceI